MRLYTPDVAPFDVQSELDGGEDRAFRLMADGFVTLFCRAEVLLRNVGWLAAHGYQVIELDAGRWTTEELFHGDVAAALGFPDYYGKNLAALNDCVRDIATFEYCTSREATGFVLVIRNFESFAERLPEVAHIVLDTFADQARYGALFGHRMLFLIQSNDPHTRLECVGAQPVMWNSDEWLDSKRL